MGAIRRTLQLERSPRYPPPLVSCLLCRGGCFHFRRASRREGGRRRSQLMPCFAERGAISLSPRSSEILRSCRRCSISRRRRLEHNSRLVSSEITASGNVRGDEAGGWMTFVRREIRSGTRDAQQVWVQDGLGFGEVRTQWCEEWAGCGQRTRCWGVRCSRSRV